MAPVSKPQSAAPSYPALTHGPGITVLVGQEASSTLTQNLVGTALQHCHTHHIPVHRLWTLIPHRGRQQILETQYRIEAATQEASHRGLGSILTPYRWCRAILAVNGTPDLLYGELIPPWMGRHLLKHTLRNHLQDHPLWGPLCQTASFISAVDDAFQHLLASGEHWSKPTEPPSGLPLQSILDRVGWSEPWQQPSHTTPSSLHQSLAQSLHPVFDAMEARTRHRLLWRYDHWMGTLKSQLDNNTFTPTADTLPMDVLAVDLAHELPHSVLQSIVALSQHIPVILSGTSSVPVQQGEQSAWPLWQQLLTQYPCHPVAYPDTLPSVATQLLRQDTPPTGIQFGWFDTDTAEMDGLISVLKNAYGQGIPWSEMAVVHHSGPHRGALIQRLHAEGIPVTQQPWNSAIRQIQQNMAYGLQWISLLEQLALPIDWLTEAPPSPHLYEWYVQQEDHPHFHTWPDFREALQQFNTSLRHWVDTIPRSQWQYNPLDDNGSDAKSTHGADFCALWSNAVGWAPSKDPNHAPLTPLMAVLKEVTAYLHPHSVTEKDRHPLPLSALCWTLITVGGWLNPPTTTPHTHEASPWNQALPVLGQWMTYLQEWEVHWNTLRTSLPDDANPITHPALTPADVLDHWPTWWLASEPMETSSSAASAFSSTLPIEQTDPLLAPEPDSLNILSHTQLVGGEFTLLGIPHLTRDSYQPNLAPHLLEPMAKTFLEHNPPWKESFPEDAWPLLAKLSTAYGMVYLSTHQTRNDRRQWIHPAYPWLWELRHNSLTSEPSSTEAGLCPCPDQGERPTSCIAMVCHHHPLPEASLPDNTPIIQRSQESAQPDVSQATYGGDSPWAILPPQEAQPLFQANDPLALSASSLDTYIRCPRKFFFRKVMGLFEPQTTEAQMGVLVHHLMEVFNNTYSADPAQYPHTPERLKALARQLFQWVDSDAEDTKETEDNPDPHPNPAALLRQQQKESLLTLGFEADILEQLVNLDPLKRYELETKLTGALDHLEQQGYFRLPVQRIFAERQYNNVSLPGLTEATWTGSIDALIERQPGQWDIVDYKFYGPYAFTQKNPDVRAKQLAKTMEPIPEDAPTHSDKFKTTRYYQLPLYYMLTQQDDLLTESPNGKITGLALQLLRPALPQDDSIGANRIDFPLDVLEEGLHGLKEQIQTHMIDAIRHSQSLPVNPSVQLCNQCGYKPWCDGPTAFGADENGGEE